MANLLALPPEVLQNVVQYVDPRDLATLPRTCRALRTFLAGNKSLFKAMYLQQLDSPSQSVKVAEPEWEEGLHDLVRLQQILLDYQNDKQKSTDEGETVDELSQIIHMRTRVNFRIAAKVVCDLLQTAKPSPTSRNIELLSRVSENEKNREFLLCGSELFQRSRGGYKVNCFEDRQLSAKLHCLYGVPIDSVGRTRSSRTYPYACSKVYDLRNYTQGTRWGPYIDDDSLRVDWEKMEAVMVIIGHNLRIFSERGRNGIYESIWSKPFAAAVPNSYRSLSLPRINELAPSPEALDPFGVTGTYMRVVCFLDFTELFAYNFVAERPGDNEPRPPLDTIEAIRIIIMETRISKIEYAVDSEDEKDSKSLPVVHFTGTSRSTHEPWEPDAASNIRGTVRLTREGEVRWETISIFQGEERWRSEGVQVGGIRSARGVMGHWFDKDYDVHGPGTAGPTAFWKFSDDVNVQLEDLMDMLPI